MDNEERPKALPPSTGGDTPTQPENAAGVSEPVTQKRNPAEHLKPYQFKKGQSGNPGGRRKPNPIRDRYLQVLEMELPEDVRKKLNLAPGSTIGDAMTLTLGLQAALGDVQSARELSDRAVGKPHQSVDVQQELSGTVNVPVDITVIRQKLVDRLLTD